MRRARPEQVIQRAVFAHIAARAVPGVFAFHPANGGFRTRVEGAILKGCGVVPGTPDIIIICKGQTYGLELKSEGGRATSKQRETIAAMEAAGAHCAVAEGLDQALQQLEEWQLLRGKAQ
jgi:hypothetical protein